MISRAEPNMEVLTELEPRVTSEMGPANRCSQSKYQERLKKRNVRHKHARILMVLVPDGSV